MTTEARTRYVAAKLTLAQTVLRVRLTERNLHELDRQVICGVIGILAAVENDADLAPKITASAVTLAEAIGVVP